MKLAHGPSFFSRTTSRATLLHGERRSRKESPGASASALPVCPECTRDSPGVPRYPRCDLTVRAGGMWQPDGAGWRAPIGVLTLHLDPAPGSEFQALAPTGVSIHAMRVLLGMIGPDGRIVSAGCRDTCIGRSLGAVVHEGCAGKSMGVRHGDRPTERRCSGDPDGSMDKDGRALIRGAYCPVGTTCAATP
jgi:hypothetical protein